MAAAAAVKASPPPPARIVVAVLAFLRFVLAPMLGLVRVIGGVSARSLPYLSFATTWVVSAGLAATIVARRVCREGSALLVFLEAFRDAFLKFSICMIFLVLALAAVILCGLCLAYLTGAGSASEFKKSTFGATRRESTQVSLKFSRALELGWVADLAFALLSFSGILLMIMAPSMDGSTSQGEMIGSVIVDVGVLGIHAISCFVIIPVFAYDVWSKEQADRKSGLTVADC